LGHEKLLGEEQRKKQLEQSTSHRLQRLRERMLGGFLAGLFTWILAGTVVDIFASRGVTAALQKVITLIIRAIGTLLFCLPALFYVRAVSWRNEAKVPFFAFVVLIAFAASRFFTDESISKLAALIEVAMAISGVAYLLVTRNKKDENT
jgi:hypothetical protein